MIFKSGTTTNDYIRVDLGSNANLILFNDTATGALAISFNGNTIEGILYEQGIEFVGLNENYIYLKSYNTGSPVNYRLFSYGLRKIIYPKDQLEETFTSPVIPKSFEPYTFKKTF